MKKWFNRLKLDFAFLKCDIARKRWERSEAEYKKYLQSKSQARNKYETNKIDLDAWLYEHDEQVKADERAKVIEEILTELTDEFDDYDRPDVLYIRTKLEKFKEENNDN